MAFRKGKAVPVIALTVLFVGCDNREVPLQETIGEEKVEETRTVKPLSSSDRESLQQTGNKFERAVASGDRDFLLNVFAFERIIEKGMQGIDVPPALMAGFQQGAAQGKENAVSNLLAAEVHFVEMYEEDGIPHLVFRQHVGGGLEYVDYELAKRNGAVGDWVIVDSYVYSLGTHTSDLMRALLLPIIKEQNRSLFQRIVLGNPKTMAMINEIPKIQKMMALNQSATVEDAEEAVDIYHSLPETVQKEKLVLVLLLGAAGSLEDVLEEDSEYARAAKLFQETYPGDASLALFSIDFHILAGDFAASHDAVDQLYEKVNDPYLKFYHAYIFLHQENYDEVEKLARAWTIEEPEDQEGWEMILEAAVGKENHELTAATLTKLEDDFGYDYQDSVLTMEAFAGFKDSDEGSKWLKRDGKNKPDRHHSRPLSERQQ